MDDCRRFKIKYKIQGSLLELANISYDICYCPRCYNIAADVLNCAYCNTTFASSLKKLHDDLCHSVITRLLHYVPTKKMPFSTKEVKEACSTCKICAKLKPRFASSPKVNLIKATQPLGWLSLDFKRPLQSSTSNRYLFVAIDEFQDSLLQFHARITHLKQLSSAYNQSSLYVEHQATSTQTKA